jgi:hypothetical protein
MMTSLDNYELDKIIEMKYSDDSESFSNLNTNNNNNNNIKHSRRLSRQGEELISIGSHSGRNIDESSVSQIDTSLDANQTQIRERVRETLTYSYLFLLIFVSPIALVALYFGLKASYLLKDDKQKKASKLLHKAQLANLSSLILGSFVYITYIVISFMLFVYSTSKCK